MNWKSVSNSVIVLLLLLLLFFSCTSKSPQIVVGEEEAISHPFELSVIDTPSWKKKFHKLQLVDVQTLDSTILVDLKYSTTDNFTGKILYKELKEAYLQQFVAQMLADANRQLKYLHPELRLLIYDAVRPLSVQQEMYDLIKDTPYHRYVANPSKTGLHNYAAAVDLTIADVSGNPLDMGTPFDFFGKAAGIKDEIGLKEQGFLTDAQIENRRLLRQVMIGAGFKPISGEWWHFNACSLRDAKEMYPLIVSF